MNIPLSWLKDYVEIDLPVLEVARILTMAGLEVDSIQMVGLPVVEASSKSSVTKVSGLAWEPDKIVVAEVLEVLPHPNADRLVLCRLLDGIQEHVVLTGAPNLFPYKGIGALQPTLKVAYAREGARLYDGHQPGQVLTTLKRAKIRGVESYSMICSEKELGISEEHEGVIILDGDAPTGMPLAEYMGDAVFEISILPNMIRNASVLGVARELAALTGKPLRKPAGKALMTGAPLEGQAAIQITNPELNPRFVLGLIRNVEIKPSPYWVQRRLRMAGMRPINNIVDATNYVMLETGEPLHAFDYDTLVQRAGSTVPTIITRTAAAGEKLTTLDGVEHTLDDFTVLVCDTAGALSIAGVMGGLESEVTTATRNILLEGASWNYINIRRTIASQKMLSEAAYRFSRGVHPELAPYGVLLGLERMRQWAGGEVASGLVDNYPLPYHDPVVEVTEADVQRHLGISLSAAEIATLLTGLEFECAIHADTVRAKAPPHRVDIGEGLTGRADLLEEIARMYGYDNIPETLLADALPEQYRDYNLEAEERTRDLLVELGLQEVINYRLTTPEREARLYPPGVTPPPEPYLTLKNPISADRSVMRRRLLPCVLETLERNARLRSRLALFEIGAVYLPREGERPLEPNHLAICLTGLRHLPAWDAPSSADMDFYDLKGMLESLLDGLHITGAAFRPAVYPAYHPGKCAELVIEDTAVGVFGELHPQVKANYDLLEPPVLVAEVNLDALFQHLPRRYTIQSVPVFPPVLEDIALIVDEDIPAARVEAAMQQAGGKLLAGVRLFDIYRGAQIGEGKKSLAYSLTYQAPDRTLSSQEAAKLRQRIIQRAEQELGAKLRG